MQLIVCLCLLGACDEVTLKSGKKFTGIAREEGAKVVLEMEIGTVGIPKDQVSNVTFGPTPLHEFYDRLKACGSAEALLKLAREQKAARLAGVAYARVIELEPENAEARSKLGHEKVGGKWTTREERQEIRRAADDEAWRKRIADRLAAKRRESEEIARIEADYRKRIAEIEAASAPEPFVPQTRWYPWDYGFFHPRVAPGAAAGVPIWGWTVAPGVPVCRYRPVSRRPTIYWVTTPGW